MRICSIKGCDAPVLARGWCKRHYDRWRRHGDPLTCKEEHADRGAPEQWIREHVSWSDKDCLIWPFARYQTGYAKMAKEIPCRMMCRFAHGPAPTSAHEVAHSCGKGHEGCVNPIHLRWATRKQNHADKHIHGTMPFAEKHYKAKLTTNQVKHVRRLRGKLSQSEIALKFGVSRGCISGILSGSTWRHV